MSTILSVIPRLLLLGMIIIYSATVSFAEEPDYALSVYGAKMATDSWENFFTDSKQLDFIDSKLLAIGLAKRIGRYKQTLSYEVEGQVVKHFGIQRHWEFNALGIVRWEPFWWDDTLETSAAFGMGPSYATEKPKAEILNEGDSQQWLLYWMIELTLSLPQHPDFALITRLHHRSEGYGVFAEQGGSNSLALGLKYRF
jgi:phytoene dehydrogenase-like protein